MKIFFVGDFQSDTGPGIANKMMKSGLEGKEGILYSFAKSKFLRVLEMLIKIFLTDCVCFCSPSKANIIGIKIAKLFKKKAYYVMHGYLTFEYKINNININENELETINKFEKYIFGNVERIFCVSKKFMEYMKNIEPEFKDKFDYNFNGLDIEKINYITSFYSSSKKRNQIVSIGGGMIQKNNLIVCEAIEKLNNEKGMDLIYIVIGLPYTEKEKIIKYDFVKYYDILPYDEVLKILGESYLYIQNSSFETFGLAVVDAIFSKCNLLVSENVGAVDIIKKITCDDLIFNQFDYEEIAKKIENVIANGNSKSLKDSIDIDTIVNTKSASKLLNKIIINMESSSGKYNE